MRHITAHILKCSAQNTEIGTLLEATTIKSDHQEKDTRIRAANFGL